jgi:hypothetical protein
MANLLVGFKFLAKMREKISYLIIVIIPVSISIKTKAPPKASGRAFFHVH